MKALRISLLPIILVMLLGLAAASCGSPTKTPSSTSTATQTSTSSQASTTTSTSTTGQAEPDYAKGIADTMLKGLNDDNLAEYTKYGDAQFNAAVTQQILDATSTQIKNQFGTYESVTYLSTETQSPYVIVHYRATYSKGQIGVRVVFDQDHLVAGQFFE